MGSISNHCLTVCDQNNSMRTLFKLIRRSQPLSLGERCSFARKFAALMVAPQQIAGGIDSLAKPVSDNRVGETLSAISADIQSGESLTKAFQKRENLFGTFFCSMVAQSELSGNPGIAFLKLSEYYEKRDTFKKKINRLLKYPVFILLGTSGCFATLFLFLIPPRLEKAHVNSENLPIAAKAIVSMATSIHLYGPLVGLLAAILLVLAYSVWKSNFKSPWFSSFTWKIPVMGDVIRKSSLQRFSLALSALLSCGFNLSHALTISAGELRNIHLEKRILHGVIDCISDTKSILKVLNELSIFPPLFIEMAKDEKRASHSTEQLKKIAVFYQSEVEAAFNAFAIIIGPVFVSITGLLGLGVLISLSLPY